MTDYDYEMFCSLQNDLVIVVTKNGGKRRLCNEYFAKIENDDTNVCCGQYNCPGCFQTLILPHSPEVHSKILQQLGTTGTLTFIESVDQPNDPIYAITKFERTNLK